MNAIGYQQKGAAIKSRSGGRARDQLRAAASFCGSSSEDWLSEGHRRDGGSGRASEALSLLLLVQTPKIPIPSRRSDGSNSVLFDEMPHTGTNVIGARFPPHALPQTLRCNRKRNDAPAVAMFHRYRFWIYPQDKRNGSERSSCKKSFHNKLPRPIVCRADSRFGWTPCRKKVRQTLTSL